MKSQMLEGNLELMGFRFRAIKKRKILKMGLTEGMSGSTINKTAYFSDNSDAQRFADLLLTFRLAFEGER